MSIISPFPLSDRPNSLGLTCNHRGLDLAGIPMLRCEEGRFRPRPPDQIAKLLTHAYGNAVAPSVLTGGLQAVAKALNEGKFIHARVAARRLGLPPLDWHGAVRILQAENALAKYNREEPRDWHGRWTTGGAAAPARPPLSIDPGSRQPSPSGSRPHAASGPPLSAAHDNPLFHLAAADEDDNGRGGLLGDFMDLPRAFRLQEYEALRTRLKAVDPDNPSLDTLTSPDYSPTQADIDNLSEALRDAQERADEPPATAWQLGWGERGVKLELQRLLGKRTLPSNTPTIDDFSHDVALSIKTIDLNAPTYRNPANLYGKVNRYVDNLLRFEGMFWNGFIINNEEIQGKVLDIVIPINSGTRLQMNAMEKSADRAHQLGIYIIFSRY